MTASNSSELAFTTVLPLNQAVSRCAVLCCGVRSRAGVLTWRDCLEYTPAWDTLIWFAILISMSNGLSESGLITTFAGMVGDQLNALNLGWQVSGGGAVWGGLLLGPAASGGVRRLGLCFLGCRGVWMGEGVGLLLAVGCVVQHVLTLLCPCLPHLLVGGGTWNCDCQHSCLSVAHTAAAHTDTQHSSVAVVACRLPLSLPLSAPALLPSNQQPVFFILHTAFFGLHYLFASQTAHIGALYAAFLAMMLAAGV